MGERAQRGYEEAERKAFRELPRAQRVKATLTALFVTGALAAVLLLIFAYPSFADQQIVGVASVIDGDTIEIHGERIRFNGIDAPESSQLCQDGNGQDYRCGALSANALATFLAEAQPTRCEFIERDRYGRFVGDCYRTDGISVAAAMVRSGLALDWARYSNGAYAREQAAAKKERRGLWQGDFEEPWVWRAARRASASPPAPVVGSAGSNRDCQIKGNISRNGSRIYHVPGQRDYAKTTISERKGERWFCSEDDARAAGWRRARR